jgi:hypothetical protein
MGLGIPAARRLGAPLQQVVWPREFRMDANGDTAATQELHVPHCSRQNALPRLRDSWIPCYPEEAADAVDFSGDSTVHDHF